MFIKLSNNLLDNSLIIIFNNRVLHLIIIRCNKMEIHLSKKLLFELLALIPDISQIKELTSNKKFKKVIDETYIHYDNIYMKIVSDWENNIKQLINQLISSNKKYSIAFLVNNFQQNREIVLKYVNFYTGFYNREDLITSLNLHNYQEIANGAAASGNIKMIKMIKEQSINLDYQLIANEAAENGNLNIIQYAEENDNNLDYDILAYIAAEKGYLHIIKYISKKIKLNYALVADYASRGGHFDIIEYAVKNGATNFEQIALNGAHIGSLDIVKYAIRNGARNYQEIANVAALLGFLDILKFLNKNIKNMNKIAKRGAEGNKLDVVKYAFGNGGNNYQKVANVAAGNDNISIIKYIASIYKELDYNQIAYYAAKNGKINTVKYAIKKGANNYQEIANVGAENGYLNVVKYAIKKGANNYEQILSNAKLYEHTDIVDYLKKLK